ncbi:DVUA0089 family protein [Yoonia sp. MH D7]
MKRTLLTSTALAFAFAAPLAAQDICSGVTGGQWIGGNEDASDISTSDAYREQMALVLGGNSYVSLFKLSEATDVRIEAAGRGAGDPLIDIFDAAGSIITSDDDSGGGGAARSEISLEAGNYCMSMKSYDDAPMTAFVRIGRNEHEALTEGAISGGNEPTGSCAEATPFGALGTTNSASVNETGFWSFTLPEPTAISITANNAAADPIITLFDNDDNTIAENDDADGLNSRIDQSSPLAAGDYCLNVRSYGDDSLPIDVTISVYDPAAATASLYAQGEASPPLDGTVEINALGLLPNRMRHDAQVSNNTTWFSFDVDKTGLLLIEAIAAGDNGDPWLILYDDLGREIQRNDDNDGLNSQITARVNPGSYIAGVKQVSSSNESMIRLIFERYVPAE